MQSGCRRSPSTRTLMSIGYWPVSWHVIYAERADHAPLLVKSADSPKPRRAQDTYRGVGNQFGMLSSISAERVSVIAPNTRYRIAIYDPVTG